MEGSDLVASRRLLRRMWVVSAVSDFALLFGVVLFLFVFVYLYLNNKFPGPLSGE